MKISRFFVYRPVFTMMVTLIVVLLGAISLMRLPVDLMPDIAFPTLSVSTLYEGAGPEEIETLITRPIERAMSAVPGVEEISSLSSEGNSNVRIMFTWGTDLDAAANDIRDRLDRVIRVLPDDAERPSLRKFDPASFPIMLLGASSHLDPIQMRQLIDDEVQYRIERVPGVAAMDVWGGREREIHVDIDPDKLMAQGVTLQQVIGLIRSANIAVPAGAIEAGALEVSLRTLGEYSSLAQLRDTIIVSRGGAPVRLGDVAEVSDRWQRERRIVRINGLPGVRLSVNKQSGTNTVDVARRVLEEIERINDDLPHLHIVPMMDSSEYIKNSIRNVGTAAVAGGVFAVVVLMVFLRNIRSTAIVAAAIPVSIVATFAMIFFGGFTLNIMTLGGLALGIGMLVDNAIVVLENIFRMREDGAEPAEAAVSGSEEVTGAIVASTLTTLAIFLPLVFLRGMAGVMFQQLAYVVAFALLCSLGVALTLIPMLAARMTASSGAEKPGRQRLGRRVYHATGHIFTSLEQSYKNLLHVALSHRVLVIFAALAMLGGSFLLIPLVGTELMPQGDEGEVRISIEMEVGTRAAVVDETVRKIEAIVERDVPEKTSIIASVGGTGWRGATSHIGDLRVALVPQSQRTRSSEEIAAALRQSLASIPGGTIRTRAGQGFFLMRRMTGGGTERVEVEIRGYDLEVANEYAQRALAIIETVPGVTDAQIARDFGAPERVILVDRTRAEAMHVAVRDIAEMLRTVISGTRAGNYRDGGNEYAILVKVKDGETLPLRNILDMTVANALGQQVVLRSVVSDSPRTGPVQIDRKNQERLVSIRTNIEDRDLGSIMADIRHELQALPAPRGFSIVYSGDYEEQQEAFRELAISLGLALILVYMVMACLYESLRDPFVVMFSVPLAIIGVVLMLFLTETTFSMQAYIGCIMLGGIVVNNAILLVDYTNLLRRRDGMPTRQAIEEAGRRRLRPILMTALTTICGLIPLALGLGEGGEAQAPMARAVIGGLLSSTLITLLVVPVIYSLMESMRRGRPAAQEVESR